MPQKKDKNTSEVDQEVRRKLLKMSVYVPPAILGIMIGGKAYADVPLGGAKVCKGGGTIIVSANGNACCPCIPTDPKYNPNKCNQTRCKLGNCSSCKSIIFRRMKDCTKKTATSGCCTCTQTGPKIVQCL